MRECRNCGRELAVRAEALPFCNDCLRESTGNVEAAVRCAHQRVRAPFGLPATPPRSTGGVVCKFCAHECALAEGESGFCGLRGNRGGRLHHFAGTARAGILHYYFDPLPTNCVADWVCAGSQRRGSYNLAVFYGGCSFDCLNCQNWHHRELVGARHPLVSAAELAAAADEQTFCVCFFGGDPSCQMPHALATARRLAGRGLRICWETNGNMNPQFLRSAVKLSLASGGTIKFDLKAYSPGIHRALTGADNARTLSNFAAACELAQGAPAGRQPPVIASTLLIPGYIDTREIGAIAGFIAGISPAIPYALLAFHPQFALSDLPATSRGHALAAQQAARAAGLSNVRVGNLHLLGAAY